MWLVAEKTAAVLMTSSEVVKSTVNVEIFAQYIFLRISRMTLHARKYDVSEKINQTSIERTNSYLRENLVARKCSLRLYARKFSCAKISTFTVLHKKKKKVVEAVAFSKSFFSLILCNVTVL